MKMAVNIVVFQIGWFGAVLGAANGKAWLGVVVALGAVLVNILLARDRRQEIELALAAAGLSLVFDTAMTAGGAFTPVPYILPAPVSPLWMIALWMNQAATVNSCMAWLKGRSVLCAVFGGVGGPLAYLGGAKLGAAAIPDTRGLVILAVGWALAFPTLFAIAGLISARRRAAQPPV